MNSKENILKNISQLKLADKVYPNYDFSGLDKNATCDKFIESLRMIGGNGFEVQSMKEAQERIKTLSFFNSHTQVFSDVQELGFVSINLEYFSSPKELASIDVAIVKGEFGVVENGAIWINPKNLKHRAILFACEHLIVVFSKDELVKNMHQAYERINFKDLKTSYFISGPSKTADIEQCLVIGAQGAKSLNVFLV